MELTLHFDPTTHGLLAKRYCNLDLPLQVLESGAGYYIGTWSDEDGPVSRESQEYYKNHAEAENALKMVNWTQRVRP
jgi:hypothetical protein